MNVSFSPKNINSIQNYFKYLGSGQNINKNKKFSVNNTNKYIHNNTGNDLYNNTYMKENKSIANNSSHDSKNIIDYNKNDNQKMNNCHHLSSKNGIKKNQKIQNFNKLNDNSDEFLFESPEEFHYFFVNIFQKGKVLNFDKNN